MPNQPVALVTGANQGIGCQIVDLAVRGTYAKLGTIPW